MAFNDIETARYKREVSAYLEDVRPPAHIRHKLDIGFRIQGQSIEIFEVSPRFDNPQELLETPVAKATYVKNKDLWKVFWQRADLKWHPYDPQKTVESLQAFLELVEADEYACFWA